MSEPLCAWTKLAFKIINQEKKAMNNILFDTWLPTISSRREEGLPLPVRSVQLVNQPVKTLAEAQTVINMVKTASRV